MRKLSWFLALVMLVSCISTSTIAEDTNTYFNQDVGTEGSAGFSANITKPYETNEVVIEGTDTQQALETHMKNIIEADGLSFKDLNGNGSLDVYEDWRQDVDARVADLLSQMTLDEKIGTLWHASTGGTFSSLYPYTEEFLFSDENTVEVDGATYVPMYHSIISDNVTTYLHNVNGTPEDLLYENNVFQEIAESARLGIPVVLSCDRSYNTFAGMVNMSNYAFGIADDEELLYDLVAQYAKEERALGFHVPFHTYGVEIGSWYGEDPSNIAKMTAIETKAYEENGVSACTKHFMARGGRSSYINAKSDANLLDSWLVGWQAAVDSGTSWVMLNNGHLLNDCNVCYDAESMAVLRETLGYDGCVVTDWPMWMTTPSASGTTPDGINLATADLKTLYSLIMNADVDQVGCFFMVDGTDTSAEFIESNYPNMMQPMWPEIMKEAIDDGSIAMEVIDKHVSRVLKNKFELGLFEDPYGSMDEVLELCASDAYKADQFELNTIDDIYAARTDSLNEMEIQLQTESTVLLKNENDLLPLAKGIKVYVDGTSSDSVDIDKAAFATYATVVDTMEEADVVVIRALSLDDSAELFIEDAQDAGKPIVFVAQASNSMNGAAEPNAYMIENADALLMTTYNCTPDHGSSMGNFFHYTLPAVLADMVFGEKQPTGKLLYSIARNADDETYDWGELQNDYGMDMKTRLYIAATVRANPTAEIATNLGDVFFEAGYGMAYGNAAAIDVNTVEAPKTTAEVEVASFFGTSTSTVVVNAPAKSGEAFELDMIVENAGADGYTVVEVKEGDTVLASKFASVKSGSFVILPIEVTLEGAGEHVLDVAGNSLTITVE